MATPTSGTPGRPGLTFEQHKAAYQELFSPEGEPPSQRQIRRYLGTGSNSTLSAYRRRIAEQRSEQTIAPEQGSLDEKRLQDTALLKHRANTAEAMIKEQRAALTAKDENLHKLEADLQSSREVGATMTLSLEDMTRQLATKAREADALEQALELSRSASKTAADQFQIEIDSIKNTLGQSQAALAAVTEQCAGLSSRFEDRDKLVDLQLVQQHELQLRLERLEGSYRTTLTQLENMRQSVSYLNAQLRVRDAEFSAENQAHKVRSERLESTPMIVEKNEALTIQLQKALKELLAVKKHSF